VVDVFSNVVASVVCEVTAAVVVDVSANDDSATEQQCFIINGNLFAACTAPQ